MFNEEMLKVKQIARTYSNKNPYQRNTQSLPL